MTKAQKPSVKEELRKIKESRREQEADAPATGKDKSSDKAKKPPTGKTEHKERRREQEADASPTRGREKFPDRAKPAPRKTEHKQPQRKKSKKSKGAR